MSDRLAAALAYAARGWPVFPCKPGQKTPDTQHGVLDATTDPQQIHDWWTISPDRNIGIATGTPGPDVIDVDVKNGNGYEAFGELLHAGIIEHPLYVTTPSGGLHAYHQGSSQRNGRIPGHHIDFRGRGGYVLAPPSVVDGKPYQAAADLAATQLATSADWQAIRVFLDPPPDPPQFTQPARDPAMPLTDGLRPGDDYAARTTWQQLLAPHGWRCVRQLGGGRACWCRPGKTGSFTSATTRDDGGLYVFTTSTEFEPEIPYSKFGAYALLEHGGDHTAASRALRAAGYGTPAPAIATVATTTPDGTSEPPEHTSWHPRDLTPVLDGDISGDPLPAFLAREDGMHLIYRGKINALIGESESGKTWIALAAVAQALADGCQVAYFDFEDAPAGITGRLRALGAAREQLAKLFRYISPDEPLTTPAAADLTALLADPVPDLIIVDGVNAAMTTLGLNLTDNKDATDFSQRILRPLKRTGAAVLTVDHVTKDREARGNYAIGAQAKRADIDGAAFIVEPVQKFGRGQQGKLKLTVSKDRPGHVRAISANARNAGTVILTSREDGSIAVTITAPDMRPAEQQPAFRPTWYMQKVSLLLEACESASLRAVRDGIKGDNKHIDTAIERLVSEGYISREAGPRNATVHRLIKSYRQISEQQITDRADRAATVLPENPAQASVQPSDRAGKAPTEPKAQGGSSTVAHTVEQSTLNGLTVLPPSRPTGHQL